MNYLFLIHILKKLNDGYLKKTKRKLKKKKK
jgi:hypothetical protein